MTTATDTSTVYDQLIDRIKDIDLLGGSATVLGWDQEVMMPPGGIEYRARQLAQLAGLRHEWFTDPRVDELLSACEADGELNADPLSPPAVNVRELRRDYARKTKLPSELVAEEAKLASLGQHSWAEARKKSDFEHFRPVLEQIVDLLRRKAECYGWAVGGEPWDALAEDFEPGCTAEFVAGVFGPLRDRLQAFLTKLMDGPRKPSNTFNEVEIPIPEQEKFNRIVAEAIGYDFKRGRLDTSTHPFTTGSHCNDIRITTRYRADGFNDALAGTMHECGHGMYEQGLPPEHIGTPMSASISLGIHESQSRMWENQVGRSLAFWKWCHPRVVDSFGDRLEGLTLDDAYGSANNVRPGFIRVEADEATYNMHVMVRFELERAILNGDLAVKDIPGQWNAKYKEYLGVDVPDDARGCLQDIHWSMAAMGYFPTYTLGNLYCAQFFEQALKDMPNLHEQFEAGEFGELKTWLNKNIHAHAKRYRAADLCEHLTGKPLSADPLMRHLEAKFGPLYGI